MYAMSWKIPDRKPAAEILLPRTHADMYTDKKENKIFPDI
jgi:hypothetical protein